MAHGEADEPTRGGLTLSRYAEAKAWLRHYHAEPVERVLAALGLTEPEWNDAHRQWSSFVEAEMSAKRHQPMEAFGAAFEQTRQRLRQEQPALPSCPPGPAPGPDAVTSSSPGTSPQPARNAGPSDPPEAAASSVDQTMTAVPTVAEEPLPFSGSAPPPPPAEPELPPAAGGNVAQTEPLDAAQIAKAVLPFGRLPPGLPTLTVEQYAAFCAECAVSPECVAAVRQRYHLPDERAHRALEGHWTQRLSADPALSKRFRDLLDRYRDWLRHRDPSAP